MEAMIKNDEEKVWMTPLLELRNELGDFGNDRTRRDYRRMNGRVQLFSTTATSSAARTRRSAREHWLRRVLGGADGGPPPGARPTCRRSNSSPWPNSRRSAGSGSTRSTSSTTRVPAIYEEVTGQPFPKGVPTTACCGGTTGRLLQEICGQDEEFFELQTQLLDIEREYRGMTRRAGIFEALEERFRAYQYGGEQAAVAIRKDQEHAARERAARVTATASRPPQGSLFDRCRGRDGRGCELTDDLRETHAA